MKVNEGYFEDQKKQGDLELALHRAIPEGTEYPTLIIVFSKMLARFTAEHLGVATTDEDSS